MLLIDYLESLRFVILVYMDILFFYSYLKLLYFCKWFMMVRIFILDKTMDNKLSLIWDFHCLLRNYKMHQTLKWAGGNLWMIYFTLHSSRECRERSTAVQGLRTPGEAQKRRGTQRLMCRECWRGLSSLMSRPV